MERTQFSTTLDVEKLENFKAKCKEDKMPMNEVIEAFFDLYVNGEISFKRTVVVNRKK